MHRLRTWQQSDDRHAGRALRRWLLLLLVGLAAGGLFADRSADAAAATERTELLSLGPEFQGGLCCPETDGRPDGTSCSMASGCSPCLPAGASAGPAAVADAAAGWLLESERHGRAPSPHRRPPRLAANR